MLSTEIDRCRANGGRTLSRATLIAGGAPAKAITSILRAQGMKTKVFADIGQVPDGEECPRVVVAWAEDPSSSASLAPAIGLVTQRFEGAQLIVVCKGIERWGIRAALVSGACGVVLYDQLDQAFGPCLQAVLAGQTCVPRAHSRQIEPPALSTREKQILGLVVMGYMNSEIAAQLFLAESTVKSHLSSAFGKLGVRSRNEAVQLILDRERGLGMGILGIGGEPLEMVTTGAS